MRSCRPSRNCAEAVLTFASVTKVPARIAALSKTPRLLVFIFSSLYFGLIRISAGQAYAPRGKLQCVNSANACLIHGLQRRLQKTQPEGSRASGLGTTDACDPVFSWLRHLANAR